MREFPNGNTTITYDEAVKFLPEGEEIHTFLQAGPALIGADWDREAVLDLLRAADGRAEEDDRIQVTGDQAQGMKHGLAVNRGRGDGGPVFIETARRTDGK